jgi:hypothetical protein
LLAKNHKFWSETNEIIGIKQPLKLMQKMDGILARKATRQKYWPPFVVKSVKKLTTLLKDL